MRRIDPQVTGMPVLGAFMIARSKRALLVAGLLSTLAILLWVIADLRDLRWALLAVLPTFLGIASMRLLMKLCGIPFNPLNVMALPVVIGIAVDDGVHLVHRFLQEQGNVTRALSGTGRSVVLTSLTSIAAFGALAFTAHRGLASFAQTLALGLQGHRRSHGATFPTEIRLTMRYRAEAAATAILRRAATYFELVKFQHTVFALPFALMGAFLGARGIPEGRVLGWVLLAMVGARTSAMAFNRIVDRRFDAENPRTASRELPRGAISTVEAWVLVALPALVFLVACSRINPLTLRLAPFTLLLVLGYSWTKRFTWLSHGVLGAALALAPFGGYVAARATAAGYPIALSLAVLLWVAGFDTVYACMDLEFDRRTGLHSLPARFGSRAAFRLARLFHATAFLLFAAVGWSAGLGLLYGIGLALSGAALTAQHLVVRPDDLSLIQLSFFYLNGTVSIVLFLSTWVSLALGA